jgi:hypothetical protein
MTSRHKFTLKTKIEGRRENMRANALDIMLNIAPSVWAIVLDVVLNIVLKAVGLVFTALILLNIKDMLGLIGHAPKTQETARKGRKTCRIPKH